MKTLNNVSESFLNSVYIEKYILITGRCLIIISKTITFKELPIFIAYNIFCNNFFILGTQRENENKIELIDSRNNIQLMHSFEVDIRICQPENSDVH